MRHETPAVLDAVSAAAGLSLGEYTALVFAGALSFEDGLKVVKARAESMAAAAKARAHAIGSISGYAGTAVTRRWRARAQVGEHGMLSVVGVPDDKLQTIVKEALAECPAECVPAPRRGGGVGA